MSDQEDLIIGARTQKSNVESYPDIDEGFSFENFEKFILKPKQNLKDIFKAIKLGELNEYQIRVSVWRYILGVLPVEDDVELLKTKIEEQRVLYKRHLDSFKTSKLPQKAKEEKKEKKPAFNPLAPPPAQKKKVLDNPWNGINEDNFLKSEIKKDVERTYQDKEFFKNMKIRTLLSNILFVWSKLNPEISYRQGMNEIAASMIVIYFQEALEIQKEKSENVNQEVYDTAKFMINLENSEADIYYLFSHLMDNGQAQMFVHKEFKNMKANSKLNTPILQRLAKITDYFLKIIDIDLFRHLKLLEVQFTTFLVRWIRCIFTREFEMHVTFSLWDNIIMDAFLFPDQNLENHTNLNREHYQVNNFLMIDCLILAMLLRLKENVMCIDDVADCMKVYINYPQDDNIKDLIDFAFEVKDRLCTYTCNETEGKNCIYGKKFQTFDPKNPIRKGSIREKPKYQNLSHPEKDQNYLQQQQQKLTTNNQNKQTFQNRGYQGNQIATNLSKSNLSDNGSNNNKKNPLNTPSQQQKSPLQSSQQQQEVKKVEKKQEQILIKNNITNNSNTNKNNNNNNININGSNYNINKTSSINSNQQQQQQQQQVKQKKKINMFSTYEFSEQEAKSSQKSIFNALTYLQQIDVQQNGQTEDNLSNVLDGLKETIRLYFGKLGNEEEFIQLVEEQEKQRQQLAQNGNSQEQQQQQNKGEELQEYQELKSSNHFTQNEVNIDQNDHNNSNNNDNENLAENKETQENEQKENEDQEEEKERRETIEL